MKNKEKQANELNVTLETENCNRYTSRVPQFGLHGA